MSSQNYNEAVEQFSTILSLDPEDRVDTLIKRGKAYIMMNLWEDALKDADEVCFVLGCADNMGNRVRRRLSWTHRLVEGMS